MSDSDGRPVGRPPYRTHSKTADAQPGDEQPAYTHAQLIRFDTRFRRRLLAQRLEIARCCVTATGAVCARRRENNACGRGRGWQHRRPALEAMTHDRERVDGT